MAGTTDLDRYTPESHSFTEIAEERRRERAESRRARIATRKLGFTARHPAWPI